MKLRQGWDVTNESLASALGFSDEGVKQYWKTLDAAMMFNANKREQFIVRQRSLSNTPKVQEDHMVQFFRRHRQRDDPPQHESGVLKTHRRQ